MYSCRCHRSTFTQLITCAASIAVCPLQVLMQRVNEFREEASKAETEAARLSEENKDLKNKIEQVVLVFLHAGM